MAHISDSVFFVMKRAGRAAFDHGMLGEGTRALVAVSGGASSTAVLKCMHARMPRTPIRYELFPVHVMDGLHGDESLVVEQLKKDCDGLGLTLRTLAGAAEDGLGSFPHRQALLEVARELQCGTVLLGHHLLDGALVVWSGMVRRRRIEALAWSEKLETDGGSILVGRPLLDLMPEPMELLAEAEQLSHFRRTTLRPDEDLVPLLREYVRGKDGNEVEKLRNLRQAPTNVKDEYLV